MSFGFGIGKTVEKKKTTKDSFGFGIKKTEEEEQQKQPVKSDYVTEEMKVDRRNRVAEYQKDLNKKSTATYDSPLVKDSYLPQSTRENPTLAAGSFEQSKAPREDYKLQQKTFEAQKSLDVAPPILRQLLIGSGISPEDIAKEAISMEEKGKIYTVGRALELGLVTPGMVPGEGSLFGKISRASKVASKVDDVKVNTKSLTTKIKTQAVNTASLEVKPTTPTPIKTTALETPITPLKPITKKLYKVDDLPKKPSGVANVAEPLIKEAKKFKTADEFARKTGNIQINTSSRGNEIVRLFPKDIIKGKGITTKELFFELNKARKRSGSDKVFSTASSERALGFHQILITQGLLKNYRRVGKGFSAELTAKSKAMKTSPLTEIFNKATKIKPTKVIQKTLPKAPEVKPSGVAKQIEAKAIEKGLIDKGFDELADFSSSTIKQQAEMASQYSIDDMKLIAKGEVELPEGMRSGTALSVVEDFAIANNDVELLRELVKSPLTRQLSESASELSLSRIRESNSPVRKMEEIISDKIKYIEKKTGKKVELLEKDEVIKIKSSINKTIAQKATKQSWSEFIDSIQC